MLFGINFFYYGYMFKSAYKHMENKKVSGFIKHPLTARFHKILVF